MKRGGLGEAVYLLYVLFFIGSVAFILSNTACDKVPGKSSSTDTGIASELVVDVKFQPHPCKEPHEIELNWGESNLEVDWGSDNCRHVWISGLEAFGDARDVIFGFRSDGVVVWKYEEVK